GKHPLPAKPGAISHRWPITSLATAAISTPKIPMTTHGWPGNFANAPRQKACQPRWIPTASRAFTTRRPVHSERTIETEPPKLSLSQTAAIISTVSRANCKNQMKRKIEATCTCPVCGYPGLLEPPRSASGGASYEICPSCGFQFGVSDDDEGFTYAHWRALWKKRGSLWSSEGIAPPPGWNPKSQLARLRGGSNKGAGTKRTTAARAKGSR